MRLLIFCLLLLWLPLRGTAQVFAGIDLGPAIQKTVDVHVIAFPHNEDWLCVDLSGGYTFDGAPLFGTRPADCLEGYGIGGWHGRLLVRNNLTYDHNRNHMFWGAGLAWARLHERAVVGACNDFWPEGQTDRVIHAFSGVVQAGWSWNPVRKHTIYDYLKLDFGLQAGFPLSKQSPTLAERNYLPGTGWGYMPFRHVNLSPLIVVRWELNRRVYGYSKGKTIKRK